MRFPNRKGLVAVLVWLLMAVWIPFASPPPVAQTTHIRYQTGDVFAGVGAGRINHHKNDGTLLEVLDTTSNSSEQTGMCFDAYGFLRATDFTAGKMTQFDNQGQILVHPWGRSSTPTRKLCGRRGRQHLHRRSRRHPHSHPQVHARGRVLRHLHAGRGPARHHWIDLAADQCTMLYTSESDRIMRYNVCTNTQINGVNTPLVANLDGPAGICYAMRIRPNTGEIMVTCKNNSYRLNCAGTCYRSIRKDPAETSYLFAMNLDPDGQTFWTAGYDPGTSTG